MSIRTFVAVLAVVALPAIASADPLASGAPAVEKQFPAGKSGLRKFPLGPDDQGTSVPAEQSAGEIQAADQDQSTEEAENGRKRKAAGGKTGESVVSPSGKTDGTAPVVEAVKPVDKTIGGQPLRKSTGEKAAEGFKSPKNQPDVFRPVVEEVQPADKPRDGRPGRKYSGEKFSQGNMPSVQQIERQLDAAPRVRVRPEDRVTIREFKKRPELRRNAPAIDIQSINFSFGSAEIPYSQFGKVENIAEAIDRLLRRDRRHVFLIEGHTDAVGSWGLNQRLSEARAASLKSVLVNEFGIPRRALETVGYGEEFLLVPTQNEDWRNRRVTLRRITDQVVPF